MNSFVSKYEMGATVYFVVASEVFQGVVSEVSFNKKKEVEYCIAYIESVVKNGWISTQYHRTAWRKSEEVWSDRQEAEIVASKNRQAVQRTDLTALLDWAARLKRKHLVGKAVGQKNQKAIQLLHKFVRELNRVLKEAEE